MVVAFRVLKTEHNIVIVKGKELISDNKKNVKIEEEHPLLMNAVEKFDGKIIK